MEFQKFYVEFSSLVRFGGSVRFLTKNGRKFGSAGFPTMPRFGLSLEFSLLRNSTTMYVPSPSSLAMLQKRNRAFVIYLHSPKIALF